MPKIPIQIAHRTVNDPNALINDTLSAGNDIDELKRRIAIRKEFIENLDKSDTHRRIEMAVVAPLPIRSSIFNNHVYDRARLEKDAKRRNMHAVVHTNLHGFRNELKEKTKELPDPQVLPSDFHKDSQDRLSDVSTVNYGDGRHYVDNRERTSLQPSNNPNRNRL